MSKHETNISANMRAIEEVDWLHTLELGGYTTSGRYDWRPYLSHYLLNTNFENKTILDVGAGDGFFSFEFERMGAQVTALDLPSQDDRDNNRLGEGNKITPQKHKDSFTPAFMLAKSIIGSDVNHITMNLYDLISSEKSFDIVFCNDVLLHLTDPFRALCAFRNVCHSRLIIGTPLYEPKKAAEKVGEYILRKFPVAAFLGAGRNNAFWLPNMRCFQDFVVGAGFEIERTEVFKPAKSHAEYDGIRGIIVAVPK